MCPKCRPLFKKAWLTNMRVTTLRPNHSIQGMPNRLRRSVTPHVKR